MLCTKSVKEAAKNPPALDWQQRGLGLYTMLCQYFDADGDGSISREEFETGPGAVREALEATFSGLDLDGDGRITPADLEAVYAGSRAEIFRAIEAGDDEWLWEHYPVPLTTNWFRGHRRFPPNRETLPRLDLPIHILQGRWDANTPAEDALAIPRAAVNEQLLNVASWDIAGGRSSSVPLNII